MKRYIANRCECEKYCKLEKARRYMYMFDIEYLSKNYKGRKNRKSCRIEVIDFEEELINDINDGMHFI